MTDPLTPKQVSALRRFIDTVLAPKAETATWRLWKPKVVSAPAANASDDPSPIE